MSSGQFPQGHPPASCEDIEKWIKEEGYHDGMDQLAKTRHLKTLTVKKCPACQAQVEKHDGSLWLGSVSEGGCFIEVSQIYLWAQMSQFLRILLGLCKCYSRAICTQHAIYTACARTMCYHFFSKWCGFLAEMMEIQIRLFNQELLNNTTLNASPPPFPLLPLSSQTCKCGMKFCWKCVRPWKPRHSDYSNCSFKVCSITTPDKLVTVPIGLWIQNTLRIQC